METSVGHAPRALFCVCLVVNAVGAWAGGGGHANVKQDRVLALRPCTPPIRLPPPTPPAPPWAGRALRMQTRDRDMHVPVSLCIVPGMRPPGNSDGTGRASGPRGYRRSPRFEKCGEGGRRSGADGAAAQDTAVAGDG